MSVTLPDARYPLLSARVDTPFVQELSSDTSVNVDGASMNPALWNLLLAHRDLKLNAHGIKPHRRWKVSTVKQYFGLTGNGATLLARFEALKAEVDLLRSSPTVH
jgi:hypothetical protein